LKGAYEPSYSRPRKIAADDEDAVRRTEATTNRPEHRGPTARLAGLVVLLSGQDFSATNGAALGVAFALGAAVLFALGVVLNGAPLPLPPVAETAWQVGLGCLPMVALGLAFERPVLAALTPVGFAMFAYTAVIGMGLCYLTWFATLHRLPPATASIGILLVPLIGIVSSALLIGEPFGLRELISVALTLGGVTLALSRSHRRA